MKKVGIKTHLKPYSIYGRRKTTVVNAFASALAPNAVYDEMILDEAIRMLGQDPHGELTCIYCSGPAETWDHLVSLVKDGELRGFGHQIGNLVPCCKKCNSRKGARDWEEFLSSMTNDALFPAKRQLLLEYQQRFARPIDTEEIKTAARKEWEQYVNLRNEILALMQEADIIAEQLRSRMQETLEK